METSIASYQGKPIAFLKLANNDLVLRTIDVCSVLAILDRPEGGVLAQPCLDLASAVNLAMASDLDFAVWLNKAFVGCNPETLVHPTCDDAWDLA